jgi:hypothetical protein
MASSVRYTLVVTSCNRHDLLRRTLESFVTCADEEPLETIIIEDSDLDAPEWFETIKRKLGWKVTWLKNGVRCGQIYSADRAMQHVTTEGIFWCEDDWEFTQSGFIQASRAILEKFPQVLTVSVRSDWNHPLEDWNGIKIAQPYWGGHWGGFMFNPGLRRRADYRMLPTFGRHVAYGIPGLDHEAQLSKKLLDAGYRIAALPTGHCHHIGGGRSRAIEKLPELPKILIAVPATKNFRYDKWESSDSPSYDATIPAYGKDIHISGPNPRLKAVRETWWKDVEPFKHHVDARFFFGQPFDGEPLADEVVLEVGDTYGHLPLKTQAVCRWAVENDYDFVVKLDDDSFPFMDRVVGEVLTHRYDYAGKVNCNLCLGGAGYMLSKRAAKIIAHAGQPDHWAEDMWVGLVLANAGIRAEFLPHYTGCAAHYMDLDAIPDDAAIIHAVKPEDMAKVNGKREIKQIGL